ncbi:MAG: hypothetical protein R6U52_05345 [Kosmotogaceae bacterium]
MTKSLMANIRKVLKEHLNNLDKKKKYNIDDKIEIDLFPSSKRFSSLYVLGFLSDRDSGGFIVSEIYNNLDIIIQEKQDKIAPFLSKYKEWWLIVIDRVSFGLTEYDFNQLRDLPRIESLFNKTVIISPNYNTDKSAFILE